MKNLLPKQFKIYFWDCKFYKIDRINHRQFIIERLLEKGRWEAVKWLFRNYDKEEIINTIKKSSNISEKTKNFWQIIFDETA